MSKTDPWLPTNLTGADQQVRQVRGIYGGFTVRETAGAAAVVTIYDSKTGPDGPILEQISLDANKADRAEYRYGVSVQNGVFVKIVSGSVSGSVRTN